MAITIFAISVGTHSDLVPTNFPKYSKLVYKIVTARDSKC